MPKLAIARYAAHKFRRLLAAGDLRQFPELAGLIEHEDRATRSDLLEGLGVTMECALSRFDRRSLRVGWRNKRLADGKRHDFTGLPRRTFANWSDCSESTSSRYLQILRRAGLLDGPGRDGVNVIRQPREECTRAGCDHRRHPKRIIALPAIRRVTELFFVALELDGWLADQRRQAVAADAGGAPSPAVQRTDAGRKAAAADRLVAALAARAALERPPDTS